MSMVETFDYLSYDKDYPYPILLELAAAIDNLQEQIDALEKMIVDTYAANKPVEGLGGMKLG